MDQQSQSHSETGVTDDIGRLRTRIDQIQAQLLQSEKMASVGQLAAGIAHEINNPVGFVSSNLGSLTTYIEQLFSLIAAYEQLEATLPDDHPARAEIARVRADVELDYLRQDIPDLMAESVEGLSRVKRIINDLKGFSRVDDSRWETVDLHQGLESTLNVIWNEVKFKAKVVREFGDAPAVRCIPGQINQVFMNLMLNAAQAMETEGTITLRTGHEGEHVWIEISDTGKGMPPDVQQRIFEPFFTTKPLGKGTGLGLSISRDIVERHGGSISVRSALGQGSTFRLSLPIDGASAEPENASR